MTKSKRNQRNRELTTRACHPDAAGIDIGAEELMEGGAGGPRGGSGARLFELHRGSARPARLAAGVPRTHGGDREHGQLLGGDLPDPRGRRAGSLPGAGAPCEGGARAQDRRVRRRLA